MRYVHVARSSSFCSLKSLFCMDVIFLKSLRPLYCDYISRILCVRRAQQRRPPRPPFMYFYSRPYARGDQCVRCPVPRRGLFLLAPLREGRHKELIFQREISLLFLLAPLREGRPLRRQGLRLVLLFLLAPLREGRQQFFTKPQVDLYDKLLKNSHFSN